MSRAVFICKIIIVKNQRFFRNNYSYIKKPSVRRALV